MNLTKTLFLLSCLAILISSCTSTQKEEGQEEQAKTSSLKVLPTAVNTADQGPILTDLRDGEFYPIVTIGNQTWMAENLRYDASGSQVHPQHPTTKYGRLYDGVVAQTVCPDGWHLPSDVEWSEMEMALGMPATDASKTGWRGEHGEKMKSVTNWANEVNGTNSSGFNGLPSGFYFVDASVGGVSFDGYTGSAGYWSSMQEDVIWVRFLGAPLAGVNRFEDNSSGWGLACRCVKNQ